VHYTRGVKEFIRVVATNSLSIFLTSLFLSGLQVSGGFNSYIVAGALLAIFETLLAPIVKILTLPFNILTLGLLSFLSTLAALFVLTMFYSKITVTAFTFNGFSFLGLSIGDVQFSTFLSFVVISATIYFVNKLVSYIFE